MRFNVFDFLLLRDFHRLFSMTSPIKRQRLLINCCFVFFFSQYGTTALMVASYSGHYECVKELIMQGADINYQRQVLLVIRVS